MAVAPRNCLRFIKNLGEVLEFQTALIGLRQDGRLQLAGPARPAGDPALARPLEPIVERLGTIEPPLLLAFASHQVEQGLSARSQARRSEAWGTSP